MSITIQQFDGPPVFIVSRICLSMPEAKAAEAALKAVAVPNAYLPELIHAPELPPAVEALQERAEADDPTPGSLKAGEAV